MKNVKNMKNIKNIYDISQEVFGCAVFPGDPAPEKKVVYATERGDLCNVTAFSMCAHNGTHIDAPFHFLDGGKTVEQLGLKKTVGFAYVAEHNGMVTAADAKKILQEARKVRDEASERILIKGSATVSPEAAEVFAEEKIELFGNESQTVGPEDAPAAVHRILLGAEIVLLEGVRLREVPPGVYWLNAAPLCLAGADGAPCRAVLVEL